MLEGVSCLGPLGEHSYPNCGHLHTPWTGSQTRDKRTEQHCVSASASSFLPEGLLFCFCQSMLMSPWRQAGH